MWKFTFISLLLVTINIALMIAIIGSFTNFDPSDVMPSWVGFLIGIPLGSMAYDSAKKIVFNK